MSEISISVVVPVYRSQETLRQLTSQIHDALDAKGITHEIILVEDCGGDGSWDVIAELASQPNARITGIRLGRNFGQDNAVLCGMRAARGRFIVTMDDDLQNPPSEIPKLIEAQRATGADVVYGRFAKKRQAWWRNLASRIIVWIYGVSFGTRGAISSFRILDRGLVQRLIEHHQRFLLLDGVIHWHTQYVERVLVEHHPRAHGETNYSLPKLMRLAISILFNYTTFPLLGVVVLGVGASFLSVLLGLAFLIQRLLGEVPEGFTAVIVTVFFASSAILLVIGIVAEYLRRMYALQNALPQFSVRTVARSSRDPESTPPGPSKQRAGT